MFQYVLTVTPKQMWFSPQTAQGAQHGGGGWQILVLSPEQQASGPNGRKAFPAAGGRPPEDPVFSLNIQNLHLAFFLFLFT